VAKSSSFPELFLKFWSQAEPRDDPAGARYEKCIDALNHLFSTCSNLRIATKIDARLCLLRIVIHVDTCQGSVQRLDTCHASRLELTSVAE